MNETHADWIARLQLAAHPEGGWFRRIYTSTEQVELPRGARPLATAIYYLLNAEQPRGRLHRNRSDILHFLVDGGPLDYWVLSAEGELRRQRLEASGDRFLMVEAGAWKASELVGEARHGLVAEVVTPGFDYADHEFADAEAIARRYPQHLAQLQVFLR